MTGNPWVDGAAAALFAVVTALAAGRLLLGGPGDRGRVDTVLHGVMALAMCFMSLPGGGPAPAGLWVAVFALGAACTSAVLGRRAWSALARRTSTRPRRWASTGTAAHHVAASLVMVVAFGAGHGAHDGHGRDEALPESGTAALAAAGDHDHSTMGDLHAGMDHDHRGMADGAGHAAAPSSPSGLDAVAAWPIVWPVVGTAFALYAAALATGKLDEHACLCPPRRQGAGGAAAPAARPAWQAPVRKVVLGVLPQRACAVAMAAGMAAMAYAL